MAGMALWSDGRLKNEESILYKLAEMIKLDAFVTESIESTDAFITNIKVKFLF
jgi:hypothetical protein